MCELQNKISQVKDTCYFES